MAHGPQKVHHRVIHVSLLNTVVMLHGRYVLSHSLDIDKLWIAMAWRNMRRITMLLHFPRSSWASLAMLLAVDTCCTFPDSTCLKDDVWSLEWRWNERQRSSKNETNFFRRTRMSSMKILIPCAGLHEVLKYIEIPNGCCGRARFIWGCYCCIFGHMQRAQTGATNTHVGI